MFKKIGDLAVLFLVLADLEIVDKLVKSQYNDYQSLRGIRDAKEQRMMKRVRQVMPLVLAELKKESLNGITISKLVRRTRIDRAIIKKCMVILMRNKMVERRTYPIPSGEYPPGYFTEQRYVLSITGARKEKTHRPKP